MATVEKTKKKYNGILVSGDLTGNSCVNEILSLEARASPKKSFSQFIMPSGQVSIETTKVLHVEVRSCSGNTRNLWDTTTDTLICSASPYTTIKNFIEWMKNVKENEGSEGIVLFHLKTNVNIVSYILRIVDNYNLNEDFSRIVMGSANIVEMAIGLRRKLRVFEMDNVRAQYRANVIYHYLVKSLLRMETLSNIPGVLIQPFIIDHHQELANLAIMKTRVLKAKTLRPIFEAEMQKGERKRNRAILLREYLILIGADYGLLESTYKSKAGEGLQNLFGQVEDPTDKENIEDLVKMLLVHFGGDKIGAGDADIPRHEYYHRRRRANSRKQIKDDENATKGTPLAPQN